MKFDLQPVPKAKNLHLIAWCDGYVLCQFKGRPDRYIFGPAIPQTEVEKVIKNPFPDRLFTTNIKNKFQCKKIGA